MYTSVRDESMHYRYSKWEKNSHLRENSTSHAAASCSCFRRHSPPWQPPPTVSHYSHSQTTTQLDSRPVLMMILPSTAPLCPLNEDFQWLSFPIYSRETPTQRIISGRCDFYQYESSHAQHTHASRASQTSSFCGKESQQCRILRDHQAAPSL